MSVIPALRKLRQENHEFEASLNREPLSKAKQTNKNQVYTWDLNTVAHSGGFIEFIIGYHCFCNFLDDLFLF
jgi:hypothetical protein